MSEYGIEFYSDHYNGGGVIKLDGTTLIMLIMQTSASLIAACKSYTPEINSYPTESNIGKILLDYIKMAQHGYTNALQSQAEFIFTLVQFYCLQNKPPFMIGKQDALLMTNALSEYQSYKTKLVKNEQSLYGENFGSQAQFTLTDWTEYNDKFIYLVGGKHQNGR